MVTNVTGGGVGGGGDYGSGTDSQVSYDAARLIRDNKNPGGSVDVDRLVRATRDQAKSEGRDPDELGAAVYRQLEEQDWRDAEAYRSAIQSPHPLQAQTKPDIDLPTGSGTPVGKVPISHLPAANDPKSEPGRIPPGAIARLARLGPTGVVAVIGSAIPSSTVQDKTEIRLVTPDLALVQVSSGTTGKLQKTFFAKIEQKQPNLASRIGSQALGMQAPPEQVLTKLTDTKIENGELRYDPAALEKAYGKPVPGWTATTSGESQTKSEGSVADDPDLLSFLDALKKAGASDAMLQAEKNNWLEENGRDAGSLKRLSIVPRRGMPVRLVTDANGRPVPIYGQADASSSTTPGHAEAANKLGERLAKSGDYAYILLQRNYRTATGRVGTSRLIPDVVGVRRDGKVDAWEVMSDSDTDSELRARLREGMRSLPKERRGTIDVIPPEPPEK